MKEFESIDSAVISLPNKQVLVERLTYALDFANRAVQHLIIEGHHATEDAPWYVRQEKIIAETSLLIVFAQAGNSYSQVKDALSTLAKILEPLARSQAMMLNICLKPALALDYGHAHICLHYSGYPNKDFDIALIHAIKSEASEGIERTPYRMLEREWLKKIWINGHATGLQFWIPLSCLNHPLDIFSESSDGVYALTHAIFYAAFGRNEIPGVDINKLIDLVEALMIRYMDEQNYDIAGELMMAWPLLKNKISPSARFGLYCLFAIEKRVGFLPAPGLDLSMIVDKEQQERRTYIYSINYHTALVMGLLSGCLLEQLENLNDDQKIDFNYSSELKMKLAKELKNGKESHWREYHQQLNEQQQSSLIPWVYQAILSRKVKEGKYAEVKELIELSHGTELDMLPMSRQANDLLQRLSVTQSAIEAF